MDAHLSLRHYGPSPGSHSHEYFQVLVGLRGVLELEVDGRGHRIAAATGIVIAPGERHDFEARAHSACLVVDTSSLISPLPTHPVRLGARQGVLLDYLGDAARARVHGIEHHGAQLLLAELAQAGAISPAHGSARAIDWPALESWTRARLDQPVSVADLAARCFLSGGQFAVRCRRETGLSPMAWVRGQRLALARQLLREGLPVALTAMRCGYRSPSALTAALRRLA